MPQNAVLESPGALSSLGSAINFSMRFEGPLSHENHGEIHPTTLDNELLDSFQAYLQALQLLLLKLLIAMALASCRSSTKCKADASLRPFFATESALASQVRGKREATSGFQATSHN